MKRTLSFLYKDQSSLWNLCARQVWPRSLSWRIWGHSYHEKKRSLQKQERSELIFHGAVHLGKAGTCLDPHIRRPAWLCSAPHVFLPLCVLPWISCHGVCLGMELLKEEIIRKQGCSCGHAMSDCPLNQATTTFRSSAVLLCRRSIHWLFISLHGGLERNMRLSLEYMAVLNHLLYARLRKGLVDIAKED